MNYKGELVCMYALYRAEHSLPFFAFPFFFSSTDSQHANVVLVRTYCRFGRS